MNAGTTQILEALTSLRDLTARVSDASHSVDDMFGRIAGSMRALGELSDANLRHFGELAAGLR
jgi:hypothetical protein